MSTSKVFISHASEDKERFAVSFAKRLRANGIDVWLDEWEMLPGDSLVHKIFEEGLKNANAVIVVISSISSTKRWVREEINAAFVKRINQASKLIPVLIDECEVPECLKSTVWQRIENLENYDAELKRIILAILGNTDRPQLGTNPKYSTAKILPINGLTKLDSLVFAECCQLAIIRDDEYISREEVLAIGEKLEISEQDLEDSLLILVDSMHLATHAAIGCKIYRVEVRPYGMRKYLECNHPDFDLLVKQVALKIVNENVLHGHDLFKGFREPAMILKASLSVLEARRLIKLTWFLGGPMAFRIVEVSPQLRRALQ